MPVGSFSGPLVVDLDGTLIKTDLLAESAIAIFKVTGLVGAR